MQDKSIDQLAPIIPPETVSFWPPQPGWYVVLFLLILVLAYLGYRIWKYRRKNAYRKAAMVRLEKLRTENMGKDAIIMVNQLLKATAIAGFDRNEVASLHGDEWLEFLDRSAYMNSFMNEPGRLLANSSFIDMRTVEFKESDQRKIFEISQKWIKDHKAT